MYRKAADTYHVNFGLSTRMTAALMREVHGVIGSHQSVSFLTLFVAYFNFLRPHSSLEGRVPVVLEELKYQPNMPARWVTLIKMSQEYIKAQQSA